MPQVEQASLLFNSLEEQDKDIFTLIKQESDRQAESIRLIPSENYVSNAVLQATGTMLTNKYSEGYSHKRYYEGQTFIDQIESTAISRAKSLFGAEHANVQPYSGSPANQAIYLAFLKPGDTVMGMDLAFGGHLTHGYSVNFSGKYYKNINYSLNERTLRIDFDQLLKMAKEHHPKMIIAGATAYPRSIEFDKFAEIAKSVGAKFVADISHISGLIVAGAHQSPIPYADAVMTTTHKSLRGPRGAMILCKEEHGAPIDKAVFPGLQGGPHNHTTAAIAVALKEATTSEFKDYGKQIVKNARQLAEDLKSHGLDLVSGGTDNHLILIDFSKLTISGKQVAKALAKVNIVCNFNMVPFDKRKPFDPSGIRLGTPAITSKGMKEKDMSQIARWIKQVVSHLEDDVELERIKADVIGFASSFPTPGLTLL